MEIGTPAKIEVTGVFESEMSEHNRKLQEVIDAIGETNNNTSHIKTMSGNIATLAYDTAYNIKELFAQAHHDVNLELFQSIDNHTSYLPKINTLLLKLPQMYELQRDNLPFLAELSGFADKANEMIRLLTEIEEDTSMLVDITDDMLYYTKAIYEYLTSVQDVRLANIESSRTIPSQQTIFGCL